MKTIEQIFTENAHKAIDCQPFLAELLGEYSWELDTEKDLISFQTESKSYKSSVQYLFSYSNISNTLQWAWANQYPFNKTSLTEINKIKELVEAGKNEKFTIPSFSVESVFISEFNHYDYAYFCSSILGKPFFICTHDNRELFVVIEDESFIQKPGIDAKIAVKRFQDFVYTTVLLDQRDAFINYITYHGYEFEELGNNLIVDGIRVSFDEFGFYKNSSLTK